MAAVDYTGILAQIKTILEADALTNNAHVVIEEEPQFGSMDHQRVVALFAERRSPHEGQSLSAGKRTRYLFHVSVWSTFFAAESYAVACAGRDTLIGNVELVLMKDRTIGGKATTCWMDGGELLSARSPSGDVFVSAGQTLLVVDVSAVNT